VDGLRQIDLKSLGEGAPAVGGRARFAHRDGRHSAARQGADGADQPEGVGVEGVQILDHHVRSDALHGFERGARGAARRDQRAAVLEHSAKDLEALRLVVDDEHVHAPEQRRHAGAHGKIAAVQGHCQGIPNRYR